MKKRRKEPETLREHCRHIFGDEPPVLCVWETEFDYADAELKALAAKEWQQISECFAICFRSAWRNGMKPF